MAKRRWKQQSTPPKINDMIEHTISKHKAAVTNNVTNLYPTVSTTSNFWPKSRYETYIDYIKEQGYNVGERVVTKYGLKGKVSGYVECPAAGMTFYGKNTPCCVKISRDDGLQYGLSYSTDELTPEKELAA